MPEKYQAHVACNFNCFLKMGISRSNAVTYTVNVVVSQKRCKMESLLLQTTSEN